MATNFGRDYRLIIGRPTKTNSLIIPKSLSNPRFIVSGTNGISTPNSISPFRVQADPFRKNYGETQYFDTIPAQFTEIKGLQIQATIAQSKQSGNPCTVSIYNLDQDTINNIRKDDLLILKAGYRSSVSGDFVEITPGNQGRQDLPDIFIGQILQVWTDFPAEDCITNIVCGEALTTKRNSKVSKSYKPNTTRLEVLNDLLNLVKTQGVPVGKVILPNLNTLERTSLDSPLKMGYVAKGLLFNEVDRLCKSVNMRMFTSLGKVYIEPVSETRSDNLVQTVETRTAQRAQATTIINIGPDQVKGSVQPMESGSGTLSNAGGKANKRGVQLTTFLNGNISVDLVMRLRGFTSFQPGDNRQRADDSINGEYKIVSVVHKLDLRSDSTWDTVVTLEAL